MSGFALDTNIISFLLRGDRQLQEEVYREASDGSGVVIPPIAYYEIKRGLSASQTPVKLAAFERLCKMLGVDEMDVETLDKAASIYASLKKSGQLIEDSDILIAASCLAHDNTLITDNTRHFDRVDGLKQANWTQKKTDAD